MRHKLCVLSPGYESHAAYLHHLLFCDRLRLAPENDFKVTNIATLQTLLVTAIEVFVTQHDVAFTPWATVKPKAPHTSSQSKVCHVCTNQIYSKLSKAILILALVSVLSNWDVFTLSSSRSTVKSSLPYFS